MKGETGEGDRKGKNRRRENGKEGDGKGGWETVECNDTVGW